MKQVLTGLAVFSLALMASAQVYLGDVRLPGFQEINEHFKSNQILDVESCANGYRVSQIRLMPKGNLILDDVEVVLGNGQKLDIRVRQNFAAGVGSRWIDVTGNTGVARCLNHIKISGNSQAQVAGALLAVVAKTQSFGQRFRNPRRRNRY